MSLASEIKNRLANKMPKPEEANTQSAAKQLTQKVTGKAAAPVGRLSNIGEQIAGQQADSSASAKRTQQLGQADQLQAAEGDVSEKLAQGKADLAAKESMAQEQNNAAQASADAARDAQMDESMARLDANEQSTIQKLAAQYSQTVDKLAADKGIAVDDIWTGFDRSNQELDFRKDASELEQTAHTMRMSDTAYIDHITRIGKMRGLEDDLAFRKSIRDTIMGEELTRITNEFGFDSEMRADSREFVERMGDMSLDDAMAIYNADAKSAATTAIITGVGKAAAAAYMPGETDKTTDKTTDKKAGETDA